MQRPMRKKKKSLFFDSMITQYGENFLEKANADIIKSKATSLFRDIANGLDVITQAPYLLDYRLWDIIYSVARYRKDYYMIHMQGLGLLAQTYPVTNDPVYQSILADDGKSLCAYNVLEEGLMLLRQTGNLSYVNYMTQKLKPYRFNL